jgi:hypothetical protein
MHKSLMVDRNELAEEANVAAMDERMISQRRTLPALIVLFV